MTNGSVIRRYALALLFTVLCLSSARAQNSSDPSYPNHSIRVIVPYTPGGPTDVMGRLMSQILSQAFGQQVYVDNRPGAGSTLGGKIAASADPDGYTLIVATAATFAIGPTLYPDAGLDPKVFVPVAAFATVPFLMIAGPKAPPGSMADVIAYAKAHPGRLAIGVPNGAPPHMLAAWFKDLTGTDILIVTYNGASGDMTDLMGGQIDLAIETSSIVLPHLADGSLRALCNRLGGTAFRNAERTDHDRKRRAWFCREFLDRPCRAARYTASRRRQAQRRDQCRTAFPRHPGQAENAWSQGQSRHGR